MLELVNKAKIMPNQSYLQSGYNFIRTLLSAGKLRQRMPGQILIFVLIIVIVLSLIVIAISLNVSKGTQNTGDNTQFSSSNNASETYILKNASALSNTSTNFTAQNYTQVLQNATCNLSPNDPEIIICVAEDGEFTVELSMQKTNQIVNYRLERGDYFDIILDIGVKNLLIRWAGEDSAFKIELLYTTANGLTSISKAYDPNIDLGSPIFTSADKLQLNSNENEFNINIASMFPGIPASSYKYLRIQPVGPAPVDLTVSSPDNLPMQVIRVEATAYKQGSVINVAPTSITLFPLSPSVPSNLANNIFAGSIRQPVCGDGLLEGREYCDSNNEYGECPSDCSCPYKLANVFFSNSGAQGSCEYFGKDGYGKENDGTLGYLGVQKICGGGNVVGIGFEHNQDFFLDDLLIMVPADKEVIKQNSNYILPKEHIIFFPEAGILNGDLKTLVSSDDDGNQITYTYCCDDQDNTIKIPQLINAGFRVQRFEGTLSTQQLKDLGYYDDTTGLINFKVYHLASGCGTVNAHLYIVENKDTVP